MAHGYLATITWELGDGDFARGKYSRVHKWTFDSGLTLAASASPHVVPVPLSSTEGVDPEEALVAAISSCHMLTFLHVARKAGFAVSAYSDAAVGSMEKNDSGVFWVARVVLKPTITFISDPIPTHEQLEVLHEQAHQQCFIAQSVKTRITIEGSSQPQVAI